MKVGDLVMMPGEYTVSGGRPSLGIIIADDYDKIAPKRHAGKKKLRIGVMWTDGDGRVDYEPRDWLEVISEERNG
jgi:hypothetical protein